MVFIGVTYHCGHFGKKINIFDHLIGSFSIWQNLFECNWPNFHCCKWSNSDTIIKRFIHTVTNAQATSLCQQHAGTESIKI